jgi:hypothetical protein
MPDIEKLDRYFEDLKTRRTFAERLWAETAKYFIPSSIEWNPNGTSYKSAQQRGQQVFDDTPSWAASRFAAALMGMVTSPTQKWLEFNLELQEGEPDEESQLWLSELANRVLFTFQEPDIGFYSAYHEHIYDYGVFGEAVMLIDRNPETGKPRFTALPLEQCYVGLGHGKKPNAVCRQFSWTTQSLVEEFGESARAVPKIAEASNANRWGDKFDVAHIVVPRKTGIVGGFATNKPYASIYYMKNTKEVLNESGFDLFPFSIPRFQMMASQEHGQGPGTLSLSNIKTLNAIIKTMLTSDQRKAAPAYIAHRRSFAKPLNFNPWKLNYYDGMGELDSALKAIGNEGDPQAGREWVQMYQEQIVKAFYLDRLLSQDKRAEVKELEILSKDEERMRDLVPQLARLHDESIVQIIRNTVLILLEKMPPAPPLVQQNRMKINYLSPLSKAQGMTEVSSANRTIQQVLLPIAQIDPNAVHAINTQRFVSWALDKSNFPKEVKTTQAEYQQAAEQQAAQQQMQMGAQAGQQVSEMAKNFAQAQSMQQQNPMAGYV